MAAASLTPSSAARAVVLLLLVLVLMMMSSSSTSSLVEAQACSQPCCGALPQGGTGFCSAGRCCSRYGYCGGPNDPAYCGSGCQSQYGVCSRAATSTDSTSSNLTANANYGADATSSTNLTANAHAGGNN